MKKKVEQQLWELDPKERKIIYRAGCISEIMSILLGVILGVLIGFAFAELIIAKGEYNSIYNSFYAELYYGGISRSNLKDIAAAADQLNFAAYKLLAYNFVSIIVVLQYQICSNIYLRKKVPYYTARRFSYLFWSKKRRKILFEE